MASAEHLAGYDPGRAAQAVRAIACDDGVGDEVRLSAAELLATLGHRGVQASRVR